MSDDEIIEEEELDEDELDESELDEDELDEDSGQPVNVGHCFTKGKSTKTGRPTNVGQYFTKRNPTKIQDNRLMLDDIPRRRTRRRLRTTG